MNKKKWYVGVNIGEYEAFQCDFEPTEESHGDKYSAAIGPFKTKRGAEYMALYGENNPHCQCVNDAERLAKIYSKK